MCLKMVPKRPVQAEPRRIGTQSIVAEWYNYRDQRKMVHSSNRKLLTGTVKTSYRLLDAPLDQVQEAANDQRSNISSDIANDDGTNGRLKGRELNLDEVMNKESVLSEQDLHHRSFTTEEVTTLCGNLMRPASGRVSFPTTETSEASTTTANEQSFSRITIDFDVSPWRTTTNFEAISAVDNALDPLWWTSAILPSIPIQTIVSSSEMNESMNAVGQDGAIFTQVTDDTLYPSSGTKAPHSIAEYCESMVLRLDPLGNAQQYSLDTPLGWGLEPTPLPETKDSQNVRRGLSIETKEIKRVYDV